MIIISFDYVTINEGKRVTLTQRSNKSNSKLAITKKEVRTHHGSMAGRFHLPHGSVGYGVRLLSCGIGRSRVQVSLGQFYVEHLTLFFCFS